MDKLKIFICCHKPYKGFRNDIYIPIHVGRSVSSCKELMQDMIGDDTGDNISDKNPYYSEATGIYWIWKNVHDCEYVGLHHYRRFFADRFTCDNIDSYFADGTDVLMCRPVPCLGTTRWYFSLSYMNCEDMLILKSVIKGFCPEYLPSFDSMMNKCSFVPFNIVICRKELYDEYAKWMFDILIKMEKIVKYSPYPNSQRVFAYISEILTPLYFYHNNKKIKYLSFIKEDKLVSWTLKSKLFTCFLGKVMSLYYKRRKVWIDPSIVYGLERAGINIKEIEKGNL